MKREGFIITYYKTTPESQVYLNNIIDVLSKENFYLVVASHTPLNVALQKKCDFYIYQEQDIVDNRKWSHGVAENNLIEMALHHMKFKGINWTFKVCYDVVLNDLSIFEKWRMDYNFPYVSCKWGDHIISTHSFFSNVDFILSNITFYHSIEEMFKVSSYLEDCWEKNLIHKRVTNHVYTFPSKEDFYGPNNLMDAISVDYNKIDFWFDPLDSKFYIKNIGPDILGDLKIVDYYTDLMVYHAPEHRQGANTTMWVLSPYHPYMQHSKNGFYFELEINGHLIRRNFGIKNFDDKHIMSKKLRYVKGLVFNKFIDGENVI